MFGRRNTMSNLQSILGGAAWMAVATLLMLATFEPAPSPISDTQFAAVKIAAGFADI
jgi:translation initiation factor 2 gamma subunit (eIF-2gamma)